MCDALSAIPISSDHVVPQKATAPIYQPHRVKSPSSPQKPLYITLAIGAALIAAFFVLRPFFASSPAMLSVATTPADSRILLDGKMYGSAPLSNIPIEGENVRVRVERSEYLPKDTLLAVQSGKSISLVVALTKLQQTQTTPSQTSSDGKENVVAKNENVATKNENVVPPKPVKGAMGKLLVRAIPNGSVSIDGGAKAQLTDEAIALNAKVGSRSIRFEHPKYGSKQFTVNLKANESKQLTCYFESQVNVAVSGESVWGTVMRDGVQTDQPAPTSFTLGAGRHRIGVTRVGYETVGGEQVVIVEPTLEPKEIRLVFQMKKK
jgi:hypothetical protein